MGTDAEAKFQRIKEAVENYNRNNPRETIFKRNVNNTMELLSESHPQNKEIFKSLSDTIAQYIFDHSRTYTEYDASFDQFANALTLEMAKFTDSDTGELEQILSLLEEDPAEAYEKFRALKEELEANIDNIAEPRYRERDISPDLMKWFTIGILFHLAKGPEDVLRVFGDVGNRDGFMRYLSDKENHFVETRFSDDLEDKELRDADMVDLHQPERKRRN